MTTGALGERLASQFLVNKGFSIIERNYRKKWGEIDIVSQKAGVVHFVEVKAVSVPDFSREKEYQPEELVDKRKLAKLSRTAALYMEMKGDTRQYQIDVVGILLNEAGRVARCRFFEQVLE